MMPRRRWLVAVVAGAGCERMGNVTLHENGRYWQAKWRDAAGKQRGKSLGRRDRIGRAEAEAIVAKMNEAPGVAGVVEAYLEAHPELGESAVALYRLTAKYLVEFFGAGARAAGVTSARAEDWYSSVSRHGMAPATVASHVRRCKTAWSWAAEAGLIGTDPFRSLPSTSPGPGPDWAYVDPASFDKLLTAADCWWRPLLALCRLAGLRRSEALSATWGTLDAERRVLVVQRPQWGGRPATERRVPVCRRLHEILANAPRTDRPENRIVDAVQCKPHEYRRFRAICEEAGLPGLPKPFRTMRRSCKLDWAREHPPQIVAEWLGVPVRAVAGCYPKAGQGDIAKATQTKVHHE